MDVFNYVFLNPSVVVFVMINSITTKTDTSQENLSSFGAY